MSLITEKFPEPQIIVSFFLEQRRQLSRRRFKAENLTGLLFLTLFFKYSHKSVYNTVKKMNTKCSTLVSLKEQYKCYAVGVRGAHMIRFVSKMKIAARRVITCTARGTCW